MAQRDAWKMLKPEEQLLSLIKSVRNLVSERRLYTRIQGIRIESRLLAGERRLYAVITDPNATNFNDTYLLDWTFVP